MTTIEQSSRTSSQRLAGGDALFIGGMVLVFSTLCPGLGRIGSAIGLLLIMVGGWLFLLARHSDHVPVSVPSSVNPCVGRQPVLQTEAHELMEKLGV